MKTLIRLALISTFLIGFVVPFGMAGAQDGDDDDALSSFEAVLLLHAESGTMAANDDDSYTLTLEGVPEDYTLVFAGPMFIYSVSVDRLTTAWTADEEEMVSAEAVLNAAGVNAQVDLSMPQYDADASTLTFNAILNNLVPVEPGEIVKDPAESFEDAILSIGWSADLAGLLQRMGGGIRLTTEDCDAELARYYDMITLKQTGKISNQVWNLSYWLETYCSQWGSQYLVPREA
jgi:hypothetical protein